MRKSRTALPKHFLPAVMEAVIRATTPGLPVGCPQATKQSWPWDIQAPLSRDQWGDWVSTAWKDLHERVWLNVGAKLHVRCSTCDDSRACTSYARVAKQAGAGDSTWLWVGHRIMRSVLEVFVPVCEGCWAARHRRPQLEEAVRVIRSVLFLEMTA